MRTLLLFCVVVVVVVPCYCGVLQSPPRQQKCTEPTKCTGDNEELTFTKRSDNTCIGIGTQLDPQYACICKSGFVRHKGKCIKEKDCPRKCPNANEAYLFSFIDDHTCFKYGARLEAPIKACLCKDGYVRDANGDCILFEDCPPQCMLRNEEYIHTFFEDNTCDGDGKKLENPIIGCRCRKKYVRHEGQCIRADRCPLKCVKANEEYILAEYEDDTCEEIGKKMDEPKEECRCVKGYVRNFRGFCVKPENCIVKCPANEEYKLSKYEDDTCNEQGKELDCEVRRCRCKKGFVRVENGTCIDFKDCKPKCSRDNEEYRVAYNYDDTCDAEGIKLKKPTMSCWCKSGYVRDDKGRCIVACDCPPKCKKGNETYIFATYEDPTCDADGEEMAEPKDACRCIPGHVRDSSGNCVDESKCPPKCFLPNEIYKWTDYEDNTCDEKGKPLDETIRACRCDKGYVRNSDGNCIKECDCPPKCTKPYEVYVLSNKEDDTCDAEGNELVVPVKACRCPENYVRDENGNCIKKCDCPPKCTKPYEVYVLSNKEDDTCDAEGSELVVPVKACRCPDNYVRDENGNCIKKCDCPPKCTKPYEVYVLSNKEDGTCDAEGSELVVPVKACRCPENYVRDENGNCIKKCDCPPKCKKENEIYISTESEDATCDGEGAKLETPVNACRCEVGYVRDTEGNCIKKCDCPPKCKSPKEIFILTDEEDPTCDQSGVKLSEPIMACRCKKRYVRDSSGNCIKKRKCPVICEKPYEILVITDYEDPTCDGPGVKTGRPQKVCRCRKKYVRNGEGDCIPAKECPPKCTGENEEYMYTIFEDSTCDIVGDVMDDFEFSCRCKGGYVRNANGECILISDCPSKCAKANEMFIKTKYTDRTCTSSRTKLETSVKECKCKKGYVRHKGECILKSECPKCEENEEYVLAEADDDTCVGPGAPIEATEACRCIEGYVRYQGKCIESCKCPSCGSNASYINTCVEDETCAGRGAVLDSTQEACRCNEGFVRNKGECVPKSECPKCGQNEVYTSGSVGDATCSKVAPPLDKTEEACRCREGFVRFDGKCILPCNCPTCDDPNEVLTWTDREDDTCMAQGCTLKSEVETCRCRLGFVRSGGVCIAKEECLVCSLPHESLVLTSHEDNMCTKFGCDMGETMEVCRCDVGYVRYDSQCIPADECPKCSDDNEVFAWAQATDATCGGPGEALPHPMEDCRCRDGYVRDCVTQACILASECPTCGSYEIFTRTTTEDPTCAGPGADLETSLEACRCQTGFVRHKGACVLPASCPKCGPNETYKFSTKEDGTCTQERGCDAGEKTKEGCFCIEGHVRFNKACVPLDSCPKCSENEALIASEYEDSTCTGIGAAKSKLTEACHCIAGYVRHGGKCIDDDECPSCGDDEVYVLTDSEDDTCTGHGAPLATSEQACRCKPGLIRHDNKCISPCDCPKCGDYEVYVSTKTEDKTCKGGGKSLDKIVEACRCQDGFVRHNHKCILPANCPSKCKKGGGAFSRMS